MQAARIEKKSARRRKGFEHPSVVLEDLVGKTAMRRGFAYTRLLTNWSEIVGESIAAISTPLAIRYRSNAICGTLVILTSGARAQELAMWIPDVVERVNSFHGYRAISDVRITQVSGRPTVQQAPVDEPAKPIVPSRKIRKIVGDAVAGIDDEALRNELKELGFGLLSKRFTN